MFEVSGMKRCGIAAAGNWIVDRVKRVDRLPGRGMLGNIQGQEFCPGGAPANVLNDLSRLGSPFPLSGLGVVGDDADGHYLVSEFRRLGVDVGGIRMTKQAPTSFTDVMSEMGSGDRVFYHHRGANALFDPADVSIATLKCKIFHLGYLLLLDAMDQQDAEYGTVASRLLANVRAAGIRTSVDVVSEESDRFKAIVPPALRHVDYLILNEIETARAAGISVRDGHGKLDGAALMDAVEKLGEYGAMQLIAVHMPEGVYMRDNQKQRISRGSLRLPDGYIAGATGAGDAFCAGMLYGLHEEWTVEEAANLGTCCAAASLSKPGASEGVTDLDSVLALGRKLGEAAAPVRV